MITPGRRPYGERAMRRLKRFCLLLVFVVGIFLVDKGTHELWLNVVMSGTWMTAYLGIVLLGVLAMFAGPYGFKHLEPRKCRRIETDAEFLLRALVKS